jgi:hypothetical protein
MIRWQPGISWWAHVQSKQLKSRSPMGRCFLQYPSMLLTTRWHCEQVRLAPTAHTLWPDGRAGCIPKVSGRGKVREAARSMAGIVKAGQAQEN